MKRLVVLMLAAACADEPKDPLRIVDAPPPPVCHRSTCNPLTQTGCNIREKCTWIIGGPWGDHIGCAPIGTRPSSAQCRSGFGADDCEKGALCVNAVCRQICDHQGGESTCDASASCREVDAFIDGVGHLAGVCLP